MPGRSFTTVAAASVPVTVGGTLELSRLTRTIQATVSTTSGNGSGSVAVDVSNDKVGWFQAGVLNVPSQASGGTDVMVINVPWAFTRYRFLTLVGTGATMAVTENS